jgi:hypothetical protein
MLDANVAVECRPVEAWGIRYYVVERRNFDMRELADRLTEACSLGAFEDYPAACRHGIVAVGDVAG